jgi:hypothetical protein
MNSRERFLAITAFQPCDRTLLWEWGYWPQTIARWQHEGLAIATPPINTVAIYDIEAAVLGDYLAELMGLDQYIETIPLRRGPWPSFEQKIIEEDEESRVITTTFGSTIRNRKDAASIPQFLNWPVKTRKDFNEIKDRFHPGPEGRYPSNWNELLARYKSREYPISLGGFPNGVFGLCRELMGVHNLLLAFYDDPGLVQDMMDHTANFLIGIWEKALNELEVDSVTIWEDMSYKGGPLISPAMFRTFMVKPYQKITRFLRGHGVTRIWVDTDGDCWKLIPLFLECGVSGLFPFEVQAGMDVVEVRRRYPSLLIRGGIDKSKLSLGPKAIDQELERVLPTMLQQGGYIPHADHLIPPDVSWPDYLYFRTRLGQMVCQHIYPSRNEHIV